MYTTISKSYHDIMRSFKTQAMQGIPRGNAAAATRSPRLSPIEDGGEEEEEDFPAYVGTGEKQEVCLDPISALAIPRSRYRTVTELILCRKNITRLHTNVQLLENLNTLIIRHNRLRQIDFLLPPRPRCEASAATGGTKGGGTIKSVPQIAKRGCRFLQRLYASHNSLQTLDGDVCNLRYLEELMLAHNRLSNLSAVSAHLKPLRYLRELDLRQNPLCGELNYRLFLIHEHPQLEVIDRRAVKKEERMEAAALFGSVGCVPRFPPVITVSANTSTSTETTCVTPKKKSGEDEDTGVKKGETKGSLMEFPHRDKATAKTTVAFLSTFTPRPNQADGSTKRHQGLFELSPCVRLLERMCRANEKKSQRKQAEANLMTKKGQNVEKMHTALHAVWSLSGHGLPFSAEKWEAAVKTMESSARASVASDILSPPQRRTEMRGKSLPARQHATESLVTRVPAPVTIDIEKLHLPQLKSSEAGHSDHSVLYDALLHCTDVVKNRIGHNHMCVPGNDRLTRVEKVLNLTTELLRPHDDLIDDRVKQFAVMRKIQEQKEALIAEPWEHVTVNNLTTNASEAEQMRYLRFVATALLLPTEVSALEGQYMADTVEGITSQEVYRLKKQTKKDKRRAGDAQQSLSTPVPHPTPTTVAAAAAALQQLPSVLMASGVQVGPPERSTFIRVLNMLDGESGAWNLDVELLTKAFVADAQRQAQESPVAGDHKEEDEQQQRTVNVGRRAQRSISKARVKGEGRVVGKLSPGADNAQTKRVSGFSPEKAKLPVLTLSTLLLDLMRYVPFVESRLAFLRRRCAMTASKGEGGSVGDSAREWFAKSQLASTHLERLLGGIKVAGLTMDAAKTLLVPLRSMAVRQAEEVGAFFRSRAIVPVSSGVS